MLNFDEIQSRQGRSYYGYGWSPAVAGQYSSVALTCGAAKQLLVDKLYVSGPSAPVMLSVGIQTAALAGYTAGNYGTNKNSGLAASTSQFFTKQSATAPSTTYSGGLYYLNAGLVGSVASREIIIDAPIIINPGHSLIGYADTFNALFVMGVEFKELG